jgi:RNA polymerase sigma factor FliA
MSDLNDPKNKNKIDHFITEHAPLVSLHIKKLRRAGRIPPHINDEDLHSVGVHGLMEALHKFQPERGHKFHTYAGERIKGLVLDHCAAQDEVPKHIRQEGKAFEANLAAQKEQEKAPKENPTLPVKKPE